MPSIVPLVLRAIESATKLMLPAAPVPKLWTLTSAPSRTLNRPVAMLKLPAAPDAGSSPKKFWVGKSPEAVTMTLAEPSLVVPTISTDSSAVTVTFPPCPAPRVPATIPPPSRTLNRLAFNVTSPLLSPPNVPAMITLR